MEINQKIKQTRENMPVVETIRRQFFETQPLKGLTIGACLHITKETAMLLMAIRDAGAKVVACASNPLSTQDDIADYLRTYGNIEVHGKKGMTDEEYGDGLYKVSAADPDYVIDDGADLTVVLLHRVEWRPKGGLEQTTTGVQRIKKMRLSYPILAVNDADTKHLFDNVYGTGQSTLDGIIRATNVLLAGKTFVVAGYGNCGRGVAQRARGMGCNVIVTEINPIKALQAHMDGFRVEPMIEAAKVGDIFVTVTGSRDVITREHMVCMKDNVILANAGHFDIEIDVKEAKRFNLNILADGRLVNLACAEGHPSEVMDMSFANQLLGLDYLVKHSDRMENKVHDIPKRIDEEVAELKAKALGVEYDIETPEQAEYR